ncbi:MAG: hypothetical protein GY841_12910 [FCB group bacterium]|nr:hypothetical protein [FCB group bacterium]
MSKTDILNFDDQTAVRVLTEITRHHFGDDAADTELTPDMAEALGNEFDIKPVAEKVSDGEMARQALLLLADDPELLARIKAFSGTGQQKFMDPVMGISLTTAAMLVLKTHIDIGRDKDGKWSFSAKSPALDKELLKMFMEKLLTWVPSGPFK